MGRGGRGGGGGGGGGGRGGPLPREVQVSKKISWLLRHGAEQEGLQLGAGGFLGVREVLQNRKIRSMQVSFDEIRAIVADNDKKRFTMVLAASFDGDGEAVADGGEQQPQQPSIPSDDPADYLIRANQGHSLKVEDEGLLQPVTAENAPETVVHGTTHAAWMLIVSSGGLKPMSRNHVHFASGLPAGFQSIVDEEDESASATAAPSAPVISGMRKSSKILMFLDMRKAAEAGIKFWVSDNGVILSEGNADRIVPLALFKRVEDRTGEGVLLLDGEIVKQAPSKWASRR